MTGEMLKALFEKYKGRNNLTKIMIKGNSCYFKGMLSYLTGCEGNATVMTANLEEIGLGKDIRLEE